MASSDLLLHLQDTDDGIIERVQYTNGKEFRSITCKFPSKHTKKITYKSNAFEFLLSLWDCILNLAVSLQHAQMAIIYVEFKGPNALLECLNTFYKTTLDNYI